MPRFVLLEHVWNGTHWDFMLEDGGALRTWAIDEPVVAGRDLPARALPDHRLAYLEFEGAVSGGRGTVRRVDEGTYEVVAWSDRRARVRLLGNQLVGEADLRVLDVPRDGTARWNFRLGNLD